MRKNKLCYYSGLLGLVVFSFYSLSAQVKPGTANELDRKFTPGKSSVLNSTGGGSSGDNSGGGSAPEFQNAVKCNIALIPRSIVAFTYERFLTDDISLEGSLGLCYNKDLIFSIMGSEMDILSGTHTSALSLNQIYQRGTKTSGNNLYVGASVKFHFDGFYYWSDNGSYLELCFRHYSNQLMLTPQPNGNGLNDLTGKTPTSVRQVNYLLNYGFRATTSGKVKTSHEFYTGVGIRNVSYDVFEAVETYYGYYQYQKTSRRENGIMPIFVMGYVLGFGF